MMQLWRNNCAIELTISIGTFRDMTDSEYKTKLNAACHIDELVQITISVGLDSNNKTVYNIGNIKEVPFPALNGYKVVGKTTIAKGNSFKCGNFGAWGERMGQNEGICWAFVCLYSADLFSVYSFVGF